MFNSQVWVDDKIYVCKKWIFNIHFLHIVTLIIWFNAWGAYLLLLPQGRALNWDKVLIQDRALISFFEKQPNAQNKTLMFLKKEQ